MIPPLIWFAPVFLLFELWQLVVGERYLGIKNIRNRTDPRRLGPSEAVSFIWVAGIVLYGLWMFGLLFHPLGRGQGLIMLAVTAIGYSIRRNCGLKWVLVAFTFESSLRVGMIFSIMGMAWRTMAA